MKNYRKEEELIMDFEKVFESYGYEKIRLNTFEKYDTYFSNKDIISEENLLKILNPRGDIYVLRPDMTLPVVKYFSEQKNIRAKYYYSDSVFRGGRSGLEFNEKKQLGIEYLGEESILSEVEVIDLAIQTLKKLDDDYILCISSTEFIKEMVDSVTEEKTVRASILDFIYRRSSNLEGYLMSLGLDQKKIAKLTSLNRFFGDFSEKKEDLYKLATTDKQKEILDQLDLILKILENKYSESRIKIDFSISVDLQYYNGLIFKGYISGIKKPILSGGRYDRLVERFGQKKKALGFCIEIDNYLESIKNEYRKIDYLFVYSDTESGLEAMDEASIYRKNGKSVRVFLEDSSVASEDLKNKYSNIRYF